MVYSVSSQPTPSLAAQTALLVALEPTALTAFELLVSDWYASKAPSTRRAYQADLARFSRWLGTDSAAHGAAHLIESGPGMARVLALRYRCTLVEQELSPATINRALCALRSVVSLARDLLLVDWELNIKNLPSRAYRDVSGPPLEDVKAIIAAADGHQSPLQAARDGLLVRMLFSLALRRSEVLQLNMEHIDLDRATVSIQGKGHRDRDLLTLPARLLSQARRYLEVHPHPYPTSPLFVALDRCHGPRTKRLSPKGLSLVLERLCEQAGVRRVTPHGLRHAAITQAVTATDGDLRQVRAFSRHARVSTVAVYDDHRRNGAHRISSLIEL